MAGEFKHTRRRTNSNAISTSSAASSARNGINHSRRLSKLPPAPKSTHTSDEFLSDFLSPSFDAASFLNASLPALSHKSSAPSHGGESVTLSELSSETQGLISQLNAHNTRLLDTLTQLTDGILRSGSRLAYEVELLRGEALSLTETMNEKLQDEVKVFIPEGLQDAVAAARNEGAGDAADNASTTDRGQPGVKETPVGGADDPEFIKQLQTLTLVRSRLESVIQTFGDAMEFVFPPSELSVSSSFLSVSAPDPGSAQQSSEEKGQLVLKQYRDEISSLLHKSEDPVSGIEKAASRIEQLKELTQVWKGTAEEKGRNKFIEGLAKMVEDRHRDLMREMESASRRVDGGGGRARKGSLTARDAAAAAAEESKAGLSGFGLINQLQKLRSGL